MADTLIIGDRRRHILEFRVWVRVSRVPGYQVNGFEGSRVRGFEGSRVRGFGG